jgi:uncharacterized protein (TIGR02594 family)
MTDFVISAKLLADASGLKRGMAEGKAAVDDLTRSSNEAGEGIARMSAAQFRAVQGLEGFARGLKDVGINLERNERFSIRHATSLRQQQYAYRQLGIQMGDVSQGLAMGVNPAIVFGQQIGQVALAAEGLGGKLGRVAAFLNTPWGAAIQGAIIVTALFGSSLWKTSRQSEDAARAKDIHRKSTEELTKAIRENEEALGKALRSSYQAEIQSYNMAKAQGEELVRRQRNTLAIYQENLALLEQARIRSEDPTLAGEGGSNPGAVAAMGYAQRANELKAEIDRLNEAIGSAEQALRSSEIPLMNRRIARETDAAARAADRHTAALDRLIQRYQQRRITEQQYLAEKRQEEQRHQREMDRIREEERQGRQRVSLGDQIYRESGQRIFGEAQRYMGRREDVGSDRTALRGLFGQAAEQAIRNVDPAMVAWCAAFVNAVLATQGIRGTGRLDARSFLQYGRATENPQVGDIVVLKRGNDPNAGHVGFYAGQDARGNIRVLGGNQGPGRGQVSTRTFNRGDVLGFRTHPSAEDQMKDVERSTREAEQALRQLQTELSATNRAFDPVTAAAAEYAATLERIARLKEAGLISADEEAAFRLEAALQRFDAEQAALQRRHQETLGRLSGSFRAEADRTLLHFGDEAAARLTEAGRAGANAFRTEGLEAAQAIAQVFGGAMGRQVSSVIGAIMGAQTGNFNSVGGPLGGMLTLLGGNSRFSGTTVKVNGPGGQMELPRIETSQDLFRAGLKDVFDPLRRGLRDLLDQLGGIFGDQGSFTRALGRAGGFAIVGGAAGRVTGSTTGGALGGIVGGFAGEALKGTISKAIGGTLGQALGSAAGPIGSMLGGLIGGAVGGLFKKTPSGSATLSGMGEASYSGSGSLKGVVTGAAKTVQTGLERIAEAFGASIGAFSVSIGSRKDKFYVDPSGGGAVKTKRGAVEFADEASAVAYALADALRDGAITGLSAAVSQALRSSSDVDKAIREALKVDEVETLLAGLGGVMGKQFRDLERQAQERVRIARQYGFDVLKIEEINAKERVKLADQILSSRIGALRELLEDLEFGDLFEGSLVEKRDRLLVQIAKAEKEAEEGVDGAADTLATLNRKLVELSRDAFGTAGGEYAADRNQAKTAAERIIQLENERVKAAQEAQRKTNEHLDEANSHLAEHTSILREIAANTGFGSGGGGHAMFDTSRLTVFL